MSSSEPPPDDPEEEATYEVGYGKPPRATRFAPGRSGNPKGRPKGRRTKRSGDAVAEKLKDLVLEDAHRMNQVRDGDRLVEMSTAQAVLRSLSLNAMKGNQRSQRMFLDLVGATESERERERLETFAAFVEYQRWGRAENARARFRGLPEPFVSPHPNHLSIDGMRGSVRIRGPFDDVEKAEWDKLQELRAHLEEELSEIEADRCTRPRTKAVEDQITTIHSVIKRIDAILGNERVILKGAG